jgi:hypothetical protein
MTPVRAIIAGLLAAIALAAGLFIAADAGGGRPHEAVRLLSFGGAPLVCALAAWGSLAAAALAILAAFLAFLVPAEDAADPQRARGAPKSAAPILIAISLALFVFALDCAGEEGPVAVAVAPTPAAGASTAATPASPVEIGAASFQWRFMDPYVNASGAVWGGYEQPFARAPDGELLCGKLWVAVSGSASEEGPADRNARRARFRTELAMARAERWLAAHPECGETVVLGVDLGQHAPTGPITDNGAATAYQRQILLAWRRRADGDQAVDAAAAESELRAFLADRDNRLALYAGRRFPNPPAILGPRTTLAGEWR